MQIRIQEKNLTLIITCPSFTWTRTLAKLTHEGWTVLGHLFSLEQRYMYIFLIVNNTTTPPPPFVGVGVVGEGIYRNIQFINYSTGGTTV